MADIFAAKDALECERLCKADRIAAAKYVRFDESKCHNSADIMTLRRIKATAEARNDAFDDWLRDPDGVRLWNAGAWYLERATQ